MKHCMLNAFSTARKRLNRWLWRYTNPRPRKALSMQCFIHTCTCTVHTYTCVHTCTVPAASTCNSKALRVTRRGFRVRAGNPRKIPASVRGSTRKVPCRVRRLAGPRRCPAQPAHCFVGCYGGLCCQSLRRKTGLLCSIKQRNAGVQMFFTHLATNFQR